MSIPARLSATPLICTLRHHGVELSFAWNVSDAGRPYEEWDHGHADEIGSLDCPLTDATCVILTSLNGSAIHVAGQHVRSVERFTEPRMRPNNFQGTHAMGTARVGSNTPPILCPWSVSPWRDT